MITLDKISKKIGARILFEEVCASFSEGNRYGLTGPNGAGKSTLLRIMMGTADATGGSVSLPKKVGFLRQNIEDYEEMRLIDVVIMGNERLWSVLEERDKLYDGEMTDAVGMRLGELEEMIAEEDGYTAESDAEVLLTGMGIPLEDHEKLMRENPTDTQFKVLLCQALFGDPDALLLDEPTNHLDLSSITWLEEFMRNFKGTVIVVSHDRHFLNSITTHIADIDYDTIITYPGNYDQMVATKTASRERQQADAKSKEKKVAQLQEFVSKFGAGTRASQVQSRLREIDRLKPEDLKKSNIQRPYIRFQPPTTQSGQIVFKMKKVSKAFETPVFKNFSVEINRGDKIAVIGPNGAGKTTLLKLLAGIMEPDEGEVIRGHQVNLGYFPQNHHDLVDTSQNTPMFDWLKSVNPNTYDQEIRSVLGKMLFPGEDAFKEVPKLSGGETARLILGSLILVNNNTLVLDEPNNHLDLEAVSALGWGLNEFKGTVICAAHDRDLIDHFATKIIALEEDGPVVYDGKLEDYLSVSKV